MNTSVNFRLPLCQEMGRSTSTAVAMPEIDTTLHVAQDDQFQATTNLTDAWADVWKDLNQIIQQEGGHANILAT